MPSLNWDSARAICCKAWGITPPVYDKMIDDGEITLRDIISQVDLELVITPQIIVYTHPGYLARMKQKRRDQANAASFEALYKMTQKNKNGGKNR